MEEIAKWMPWCHTDYSYTDCYKWIELSVRKWAKGDEYSFAITDIESGSIIGGCGLNRINESRGQANLGYWVHSAWTGRGIATEAAYLTVRFGFDTLKLHMINVMVAIENKASIRVADKLGAHKRRTVVNRIIVGDKKYDAAIYSLHQGNLKAGNQSCNRSLII
jgi:RimJ/RimL family protein N-acetyltransferase